MRKHFAQRLAVSCAVIGSIGAAASLAVARADPAGKVFSLEAARAIVTVSAPSISPDATQVVYVRAVGDFKTDTTLTELVLVDVRTGATRQLTRDRDDVAAPAWSPQGDRVAFLAAPKAKEPAQLFVMPMAGGDARQVTKNASGVAAFAWKPDGTQLAYVARDAATIAKAVDKHRDLFTVGDEHFLSRAASLPAHVWLVGADGAQPRALTRGATSVALDGAPRWSPDGQTLLYPQQPDATFGHFTKTRVMAFDLARGTDRAIVPNAVVTFATYSPDGSHIAYIAPRHGSLYLQNDAYVVSSSDGSRSGDSLAIDRNAKWVDFLPDGTLAYGASDGVRDGLWFVPPGAAPRRVDLGDVDFSADASVAKDGSLAFVGESKTQPPEIYVLAPNAAAPRRISDENAFIRAYALGRVERIDWTSDGLAACGVLTYPPTYVAGKTYPLVLVIHGGPVSTSTWNFSRASQVLAARGFLVFNPNYRGSDDLGDAYLQAIVGHPTSGPGRDNLAGVAAVERLGIVDTTRVGVSGWSGGGLQTSWLIGHAHLWKAAVSGAAVDDWFEQAVLSDINEEFADVFMGGATPWTAAGRALFASESPITYADRISTPLLILSDTGDQRVPITQSYALFHALRDRGRRVRFVAFPRAGHFPTDPVGDEAVRRAWYDYLTAELRP